MSELFVRAVDLAKSYSVRNEDGTTTQINVFDGVNFSAKKGDVIGIIGANGSGKSTLLKLIAGVTKPSAGYVESKGAIASLLDIGAGFHPEMTGRENVILMGQLQGISKKQSQPIIENILKFSEIGKFSEIPIKHYSKGMYLRLAFSTMIHLPFDIYLLDEVLSVGDINFQMKCKRLIQQMVLSKEKIIFVISHNYNELKELCTAYFTLFNNSLISFDSLDAYFSFMAENAIISTDDKYDIWSQGMLSLRPYDSFCCSSQKKEDFQYSEQIPLTIQFSGLYEPVQFGFAVKDEFQQTVFQSYFKQEIVPSQSIEIQLYLPSHFFNQGFYEIDLFCFRQHQLIAIEANVFKFYVSSIVHEQSIANRTWGPTKPEIKIQSINYAD